MFCLGARRPGWLLVAFSQFFWGVSQGRVVGRGVGVCAHTTRPPPVVPPTAQPAPHATRAPKKMQQFLEKIADNNS